MRTPSLAAIASFEFRLKPLPLQIQIDDDDVYDNGPALLLHGHTFLRD